ncbi:MAG: RHS repeat-associated core domain-containing protein, partial [Armatimonadota bacterium]
TGAFNLRNASGTGTQETTNYYYDGIRPIWETDGAGALVVQSDRDLFGNLLSRRLANNARRYYHYDGIGSTTALTTENGTLTATLLYEAWGKVRAASGGGQGVYRFTGAELDATTGLYHMGARFYDPTIGRWLSEDPVQDKSFEPATLNFYAYVVNNPTLLIDPHGTDPFEDVDSTGDDFHQALENARREGAALGAGQVESRKIDEAARALQDICKCDFATARRIVLDIVSRAGGRPSAGATLAQGLYIASGVFFVAGAFASATWLTIRGAAAATAWVRHETYSVFINIGTITLAFGFVTDAVCCGAVVLRAMGRSLSDWLRSRHR